MDFTSEETCWSQSKSSFCALAKAYFNNVIPKTSTWLFYRQADVSDPLLLFKTDCSDELMQILNEDFGAQWVGAIVLQPKSPDFYWFKFKVTAEGWMCRG